MDWSAWAPFYRAIRRDFGYDAASDRAAARLLDAYVAADAADALAARLDGARAVVAGDGPGLEREVDATHPDDAVVIAADGAARRLDEVGVAPDVVVTDLDGAPTTAAALADAGTTVVVHAHGDNADLLEEWLPALADPVGTTQVEPVGALLNPGGFTDGDRAAFLADACGAAMIELAGFRLDDPAPPAEKRWKLRWAERLLRWLEDVRGERLLV